jgi:hypothetical protein
MPRAVITPDPPPRLAAKLPGPKPPPPANLSRRCHPRHPTTVTGRRLRASVSGDNPCNAPLTRHARARARQHHHTASTVARRRARDQPLPEQALDMRIHHPRAHSLCQRQRLDPCSPQPSKPRQHEVRPRPRPLRPCSQHARRSRPSHRVLYPRATDVIDLKAGFAFDRSSCENVDC